MANVRLLPALMATVGVVLAMKAVAVAEAASDAAPADLTAAPIARQAPPQSKAPAPACPPSSFAQQAGLSATEVEVLQSLGQRRSELDARAADLDTQSALLGATQQRVDDRLVELKRIETTVSALLAKADDAVRGEGARRLGVVARTVVRRVSQSRAGSRRANRQNRESSNQGLDA